MPQANKDMRHSALKAVSGIKRPDSDVRSILYDAQLLASWIATGESAPVDVAIDHCRVNQG